MILQELMGTIQSLFGGGKGLLAMNENHPPCNNQFASFRIAQTLRAQRAYRKWIGLTSDDGKCIIWA